MFKTQNSKLKILEGIGVLLMAYGTPEGPEQVEAYYTHIRGGRKPSPEAVENLRDRYRTVGGRTPLLAITNEVAAKLEARLKSGVGDAISDAGSQGAEVVTSQKTPTPDPRPPTPDTAPRVYVGMKHWHPFIGDVMEQMAAEGIKRVVAVALAPHYSRVSIGGYRRAVEDGQERLGNPFEITFVDRWHDNPLFREMMAGLVGEGLQQFDASVRSQVAIVFTAHSLPERIREWDDPYERELWESSAAVAERLGLEDWRFAFQSAGHTGEPWLGPDILDCLEAMHAEGKRDVLVVPIGFVSDHLEILYDLDVEAKQKAADLGMTLHRTQLPNARPDFIDVLASVVTGLKV
jgi:protoporphyrin/coproporphyrin ferrochelatase